MSPIFLAFIRESHPGNILELGRNTSRSCPILPNLPVSESKGPGLRPFLVKGRNAALPLQGLV